MAETTTKSEKSAENTSKKIAKDKIAKLVKSPKVNSFVEEFKTFINRGSVVDLAVGIVVGGAFTKIVSSLVSDILMPLVGVLLGGVNFSALNITVPNIFGGATSSRIAYGMFLQNVVDFLVIAVSVFIIVRFINRLQAAKSKIVAQPETENSKTGK